MPHSNESTSTPKREKNMRHSIRIVNKQLLAGGLWLIMQRCHFHNWNQLETIGYFLVKWGNDQLPPSLPSLWISNSVLSDELEKKKVKTSTGLPTTSREKQTHNTREREREWERESVCVCVRVCSGEYLEQRLVQLRYWHQIIQRWL